MASKNQTENSLDFKDTYLCKDCDHEIMKKTKLKD